MAKKTAVTEGEEQLKFLPAVLKRRAERILGTPVVAAYRLNDNPNVARLELKGGKLTYVDFRQGKEVEHTELNVTVDEPAKPAAKKGNYASLVTREDVEGESAPAKKATRKKKKK